MLESRQLEWNDIIYLICDRKFLNMAEWERLLTGENFTTASDVLTNTTNYEGPRSYYEIYGVFFIGVSASVFLSLTASIYWVCKRRASVLTVLPLYIIYLSLGDFISDFTFIEYMPRKPQLFDDLRNASFVFILGASVMNVAAASAYLYWCIMKGGAKYEPFRRWLQKHKLVTAILLFMSLTSARMLTLLYSSLFDMVSFSAPLPLSAVETLEIIGMITVIVEDLPQLVVTIYISTVTNTWDSVAFTALAFALISILVTVGCRIVMLRHITDEERQAQDSFNPEYLKAHKAYRKGSLRTMRHMYDVEERGYGGGVLHIESRMPEQLVSALRAIGAQLPPEEMEYRYHGEAGRIVEPDSITFDSTVEQLQPYDVYAAVSVPPSGPKMTSGKRRPSLFRKASEQGSRADGHDDPGATMAAAYAALAAAAEHAPEFEPGKYIMAAASRRNLAQLPTGPIAVPPPVPCTGESGGSGDAPELPPDQAAYAGTSHRQHGVFASQSGDTGGTALDEYPEERESPTFRPSSVFGSHRPPPSMPPSSLPSAPSSLGHVDSAVSYNPFRQAVEMSQASPAQAPVTGWGEVEDARRKVPSQEASQIQARRARMMKLASAR